MRLKKIYSDFNPFCCLKSLFSSFELLWYQIQYLNKDVIILYQDHSLYKWTKILEEKTVGKWTRLYYPNALKIGKNQYKLSTFCYFDSIGGWAM